LNHNSTVWSYSFSLELSLKFPWLPFLRYIFWDAFFAMHSLNVFHIPIRSNMIHCVFLPLWHHFGSHKLCLCALPDFDYWNILQFLALTNKDTHEKRKLTPPSQTRNNQIHLFSLKTYSLRKYYSFVQNYFYNNSDLKRKYDSLHEKKIDLFDTIKTLNNCWMLYHDDEPLWVWKKQV
jgi:hypothetical protein